MMHFMVPAKSGQVLTKDFFDGCPVEAAFQGHHYNPLQSEIFNAICYKDGLKPCNPFTFETSFQSLNIKINDD